MFKLEDVVEEKFSSFDETLAFVSEEKRRIVRRPISGLWKDGARFHEDGCFGDKSTLFKLNNYGFQAVCNLVGVSDQTLLRLRTPELASRVLNDLLSGSLEREKKTARAEVVCDEERKSVIGVVSNKYIGYSNDTFVRDVLICLDEGNNGALFPNTGDFLFKEAYSINSRLFLRLASKSVKGVVSGRGGTGDDVSEIGVEVSNSMAGGHAVRLSWFVFRLICANGLVTKVADAQGRVIHSGTEKSFRKRLYASTAGLFQSLGKAKRMIENLGSIPFKSHSLARHADLKLLFSIIPDRDLKAEALEQTKNLDYRDNSKCNRELERLSDAIAAIPHCLGGPEALSVFRSGWRDEASMYDFINIFTEHAKTLTNGKKIEAESRAGEFAGWISQNKRKFS
jgi:hypothetical protein